MKETDLKMYVHRGTVQCGGGEEEQPCSVNFYRFMERQRVNDSERR